MESNQNPDRRPIRVTRSTWLLLMAIVWSLTLVFPAIFFSRGLPGGVASILAIGLLCLGLASFIWMPLVFAVYCLGKPRVTAGDSWRFFGVTILAATVSSGVMYWWIAHSWLD
jgi:hypothetical protein